MLLAAKKEGGGGKEHENTLLILPKFDQDYRNISRAIKHCLDIQVKRLR